MSLPELQLLISQLPRAEQAELLRVLSDELHSGASSPVHPTPALDREAWVKKLEQLQSLTASKTLRPSLEVLDELRADRI